MRQISKRLFALILTCVGAAAQTAPAPATKKAIFWKVTSPTSTVYLLGSIHLGSKDMYPLPKEIEDAFEGSAAAAGGSRYPPYRYGAGPGTRL